MSTRHLAPFVLLLVLASGAVASERQVDQTRALAPDGTVEITIPAGSVSVVGWDRAEVRITGTLDHDVRGLDIDGSSRTLGVEVEVEGRYAGEAHLKLEVPSGANVEIESIAADVEVSGVIGELSLEAVSGEVVVRGRPRALEAASVSGDVRVAFAPDRSRLETVSGDLVVDEAGGRLDAESVSGSIHIAAGVVADAGLESVSGSVRLASELAAGGSIDIETMSGDVELVLPATLSADVDLSTFSGSITSALGPAPKRSGVGGSGSELRFAAGSGAGRVTVTSFSGSITLKTR